jgi:hypothetical protein
MPGHETPEWLAQLPDLILKEEMCRRVGIRSSPISQVEFGNLLAPSFQTGL